MTIKTRPATAAELHDFVRVRAGSGLLRFRHGVHEVSSPRAKNGVAHRQYSRATVKWCAEVALLFVAGGRYRNEALAATHCTLPSGATFLTDIRVSNIPSNV